MQEYFLGWGILSMVISTLAQALNRGGIRWFIFGLIFGPIAMFFLMLSGKVNKG